VRRKEEQSGTRPKTSYSVLIVDDDEIIRRGIAAIISAEPDFCVCGLAADEATAVKLLQCCQPRLLLLDLSLGHRDGLQFLKDLAGRFAGTRIIALCAYRDELYGRRSLQAGAVGYLTKCCSAKKLVTALRSVVSDRTPSRPLCNRARHKVAAQSGADKPERGIANLTDRELHVFRLIGTGLGTGRIAQELGLSRKTIETYREHIKLKFGYADAEALRRGALEWVTHAESRSLEARKNQGNPR